VIPQFVHLLIHRSSHLPSVRPSLPRQEGKLAEALIDTASYVKKRQEIDAENLVKLQEGLAKSRQRLMGDLDSIFGASEDIGLTKTLDKVGREGGREGGVGGEMEKAMGEILSQTYGC